MSSMSRTSDRINLYPAAPIRLATMLRAWTITEQGMGLIFTSAPSPNGRTVTHPTRQPGSPKASCSCSALEPHKWTVRWRPMLETVSSCRSFRSMLKQSKELEAASFSLIASLPPTPDDLRKVQNGPELTQSRHGSALQGLLMRA